MARFEKLQIESWTERAELFLSTIGHSCKAVKLGRDAWTVAHRTGITKEAYLDHSVTDGHIQTALETIFPNAHFHDKKRY